MDPRLVTSLLLSVVVIWALFRRVRRTFGRQPLNPPRLYLRIAVLSALGVLVLVTSTRNPNLLMALLGGVAAGAALGYLGLRHTQFAATPEGRFYTPHTYIGMVVMALFLGRLLYRFLAVYLGTQPPIQPNEDPLAAYQRSPLTLAIFGLLIGYYVVFNLGVLRKGRQLTALTSSTPGS